MTWIVDTVLIEPSLYHVTANTGAVFAVEEREDGWRWRYYDDPTLSKVSVGKFENCDACLEALAAYLQQEE